MSEPSTSSHESPQQFPKSSIARYNIRNKTVKLRNMKILGNEPYGRTVESPIIKEIIKNTHQKCRDNFIGFLVHVKKQEAGLSFYITYTKPTSKVNHTIPSDIMYLPSEDTWVKTFFNTNASRAFNEVTNPDEMLHLEYPAVRYHNLYQKVTNRFGDEIDESLYMPKSSSSPVGFSDPSQYGGKRTQRRHRKRSTKSKSKTQNRK